jgi:hypothetical protein
MKRKVAILMMQISLQALVFYLAAWHYPFHGSLALWPSYELTLIMCYYSAWYVPELVVDLARGVAKTRTQPDVT